MKLDLSLICAVVILAAVGFSAATENRPSELDLAQAAFEKHERAKSSSYDFDAWREAGDMSCQNAPTLRICRAHPIVVSAIDGGPTRDFMSFACSTTECVWVDP